MSSLGIKAYTNETSSFAHSIHSLQARENSPLTGLPLTSFVLMPRQCPLDLNPLIGPSMMMGEMPMMSSRPCRMMRVTSFPKSTVVWSIGLPTNWPKFCGSSKCHELVEKITRIWWISNSFLSCEKQARIHWMKWWKLLPFHGIRLNHAPLRMNWNERITCCPNLSLMNSEVMFPPWPECIWRIHSTTLSTLGM